MRKKSGSIIYPTRSSGNRGQIHEKGLVEAALISMRVGLATAAMNGDIVRNEDRRLVEYSFHNRLGKLALFTTLAEVEDGFILEKTTNSFLTNFAHMLKIPTNGAAVSYQRHPFNVDSQCLTPSTIQLSGIEEISHNKDAVISILDFERDVVYGALTNWVGYVPVQKT